MIDMNDECAGPSTAKSQKGLGVSSRRLVRLALMAPLALGCGELLMNVWRVAGDENLRQTTAAVRALGGARTSGQRVEAIQDLVRPVVIDGPVVIPHLIRSLGDPNVLVRVEAVRSLASAASAAALLGIANGRVTAAIEAIIRSLDDREPAVRIAAVQALGAIAASKNPSGVIHPRRLVDAVATMFDDPDATVRASTIASLAFAGPSAAHDPPPALIAALDDESAFNRAAARQALARFSRSGD
jgi:HEAT repeat protein